jgi:molybdenum cofactor cytidylyltransferase
MGQVGILLAAGKGRRFDPTGFHNKLLLPLRDGTPVVVASARALLAVLPRVIAVVRPDDTRVAALLQDAGCEVSVCIESYSGMAASLVHGLELSLPDGDGWVIALGDMPYVQASTIQGLSDALAAGAGIAVPVCDGKRGNPVGFSTVHLPALLALSGDRGARSIVYTNLVTEVEVPDQGIFDDIDTPSDLQKNATLAQDKNVK